MKMGVVRVLAATQRFWSDMVVLALLRKGNIESGKNHHFGSKSGFLCVDEFGLTHRSVYSV